MAELTPRSAIDTRHKYVAAFNGEMIKIWKERIALLKVIDTGALYNSIISLKSFSNPDASDIEMTWGFNAYGLYQELGTGREMYRGNPGDIGRPKARQRRPWLGKAFYSSMMNIKEFMAGSLGKQAMAIIANTFTKPIEGDI